MSKQSDILPGDVISSESPASYVPAEPIRVNIRPTLIIGLGGTGTKVAVELKARLEERFGESSNYHQAIRFLSFDTANENFTRTQPNHPEREVRLSREEEFVRISDVPLHDLMTSRTTNPAIAAILPDILHSTQIDQGAQQVRRLGRIALFYHYDRIKEALDNTISSLRRIDVTHRIGEVENYAGTSQTAELFVTDRNRLRVFILCSICGGTGSGIFLDMAYLTRHIAVGAGLPSARHVDVIGMLMLPGAFPEIVTTGAHRIRANAYAALSDLEYYNRPSIGEEAHYQVELPDETVEVPGAPFDLCYLVDRSSKHSTLGGMNDIAPVLGDALLNMVASRPGEQLDATLDNIRGSLSAYLGGYRAFYSVLSIAQLVYPRAWLRRQFRQELQRDLIERYILRESNKQGVQQEVESWWRKAETDLDERLRDGLPEESITRSLTNLRKDVAFSSDLTGDLQTAFRAAYALHQQRVATRIQENQANASDKLVSLLSKHLRVLIDEGLTPGSDKGLRWALDWLDELKTYLEEILAQLSRDEMPDPSGILNEQVSAIMDSESIVFVGGLFSQQRTRSAATRLSQFLTHTLRDALINDMKHQILSDLVVLVVRQRQDVTRAIGRWEAVLPGEADVAGKPNTALTTRFILTEEAMQNEVRTLARRHLSEMQIGATLSGLARAFQNIAAEYIAADESHLPGLSLSLEESFHEMLVHAMRDFADALYKAQKKDIVDRLQNVPDSATYLSTMSEQASPLLVYNEGMLQAMRPRQIKVLAARTTEQAEQVKRMGGLAGTSDISPVENSDADTINLLVTHHGIPAVALNRFEEYRRHYTRLKSDPRNIFHLDKTREHVPYDPGSYYFVDPQGLEMMFSLALAYGWIHRYKPPEYNHPEAIFGFTREFYEGLKQQIESELTRLQNEIENATGKRYAVEEKSYVYLRLTTRIEMLKNRRDVLIKYRDTFDQMSKKYNSDMVPLFLPAGENFRLVNRLDEALSALRGGVNRALAWFFVQAAQSELQSGDVIRTSGILTAGNQRIEKVRQFLADRKIYVDTETGHRNDGDATMLWHSPGQSGHVLEERVCALLLVHWRIDELRHHERRLPPGFWMTDKDITRLNGQTHATSE